MPYYRQEVVTLLVVWLCSITGVASQCEFPTCTNKQTFDIDTPDEYYASAKGLSGSALKAELNSIIRRNHFKYNYTCTWDALADIYEDEANPANVIAFYTNRSIAKLELLRCIDSPDSWNREHLWPRSRGFKGEDDGYAHNDLHHLVPADKSVNFDRGNADFKAGGIQNTECTKCNAVEKTGINESTGEKETRTVTWEPPSELKGEVARKMFYMEVRYNDKPNLELVNRGTKKNEPKLGYLDELLKWHCEKKVTEKERSRNNQIQQWQGNRNPFIDNPEYVGLIWNNYSCPPTDDTPPVSSENPGPVGDDTTPPVSSENPGPVGDDTTPPVSSENPGTVGDVKPSVWINEIHYDNAGEDRGEFVEIGCNTQDFDLSGYKIELYNGYNGMRYNTADLSGICSTSNGFIVVDLPGMQNGSPDGLALVNANGSAVEFISYEGSFRAKSGAAKGMESVDILVSENSRTQAGDSLQRVGKGCDGSSFTWIEPTSATKGRVNGGQTISCSTKTRANDEL